MYLRCASHGSEPESVGLGDCRKTTVHIMVVKLESFGIQFVYRDLNLYERTKEGAYVWILGTGQSGS